MSAFLTSLAVELMVDASGAEMRTRNGRQLWRVIDHPFAYRSDVADTVIVIPVGFVTDFASIPLSLQWLFGDVAHRASLPHDFEYSGKGSLSREIADKVLREACLVSGISELKAALIYAVVRVFGGSRFRTG